LHAARFTTALSPREPSLVAVGALLPVQDGMEFADDYLKDRGRLLQVFCVISAKFGDMIAMWHEFPFSQNSLVIETMLLS
jgi:hypothetical protein